MLSHVNTYLGDWPSFGPAALRKRKHHAGRLVIDVLRHHRFDVSLLHHLHTLNAAAASMDRRESRCVIHVRGRNLSTKVGDGERHVFKMYFLF